MLKKIIKYDAKKIKSLLANPGIIRNKLKIAAFISNAHAYLEIKREYKSFSDYLWNFVDNKPIKVKRKNLKAIPTTNEISDRMSKDLKKRGFKFVGSTICYAFMQAVGMIDDHTEECFLDRQKTGGRSRKDINQQIKNERDSWKK